MKRGRRATARGSGSVDSDLHAAARSGDLAAVNTILCSNPLAVNNRDKHSRTPLHLAAWAGQAEVVSLLCKNKADAGAAAMDDMAAIHFAAQKGHLEVVKALVSFGVSVKAATRRGVTPLHYAAQASNLDLVKYLVKKGASPATVNKAGKTPADLATSEDIRAFLQSGSSGSDVVENVESKSEDINPTRSSPETPALDKCQQAEDETTKRKDDGSDIKESGSMPKRSRVALSHLVTEDDTENI